MKGDAATRAALRAMTAMDDAMKLPDEPIRAKPSGGITEDMRARLEQAYERAAIHIYSETLMVLSETDLAAILAASSPELGEDGAWRPDVRTVEACAAIVDAQPNTGISYRKLWQVAGEIRALAATRRLDSGGKQDEIAI